MPTVRISLFPPNIGVDFSESDFKEFRNLLGAKASQLFKAKRKDFIGNFYIISKHSNKCLDVAEWSRDDTANVFQYSFHGGDNQQWTLVRASKGYYYIFAKHSGKCLDVAGWSKDDTANVFQYSFHGGDNQQWELQETPDGYFHIIAKHSGKALDVEGSRQYDGANVWQYTLHGGDNQKWKLQSAQ